MKKLVLLLIVALALGASSAQAVTGKRLPRKARKVAVAAVKYNYTGTYENSFADYEGNPVTTYLAINYDASTGEATGEYKNDEGEVIPIVGKEEGGKLKCHQADPNADLLNQVDLTLHFYDNNRLKVDEISGAFKRTSSEYTAIEMRA
ncbi:MAG: hypothetical protein SPL48_05915, partial [Bacteroidales bacterium]|nr:hypothetical protein [Bacteroidales bacterium]